ncbi:MAG: hypothetical protein JWN84_951 [Nocardioides sp.]|jgi:hypothetical protein|nr:hypothetical protein [Nocardioides sp.]
MSTAIRQQGDAANTVSKVSKPAKPTNRQRRVARRERTREVTEFRIRRAARDMATSMKETTAEKRERRLTDLNKLVAAAADHHLYLRAAALPEKGDRTPGRPTMFPNFVMLLFGQAISIFGSAANTSVWFSDDTVWNLVRDTIRDNIDPKLAADLPDTGPMLHQWNHFHRKFKKRDWHALLHDAQRATAAQRALDMGMFDPAERFRITDPDRRFVVTFDGKVSTSPSRHAPGTEWVNKVTGEVKTRKFDPNSKSWPEGGTAPVPPGADAATIAKHHAKAGARFEWGPKGTYAYARLAYYGTRLILDVETMSPEDGDEAAAIARITDGLLDRLPGIQTLVMDGVYKSVHVDPYMRKGLLVINKPTSGPKNSANSVKIGERWEKSHHIETVEVPRGTGVCRHRIYGIGGAPYEQKVDAAGTPEYVLLTGHTIRRKRSTYTDWYRIVNIECTRCGGKKEHAIALGNQKGDGFKRSEYLRQVPMTDEQFKRAYGFRPDAESGNKDIEEAWHLKRMPAWGWHNQALRMLLHAGQVNAEAWAIHLSRLADHDVLPQDDGDPQVA